MIGGHFLRGYWQGNILIDLFSTNKLLRHDTKRWRKNQFMAG